MPASQALPGDVGADQRRVDMHNFASGDPGCYAGLHSPLDDAPEPLGAPALPDPRERVVGQPVSASISITAASGSNPDLPRVELANLDRKPREIEHPVDARQHVIVWNQITQRAADEELELSPLLPSQHSDPARRSHPDCRAGIILIDALY